MPSDESSMLGYYERVRVLALEVGDVVPLWGRDMLIMSIREYGTFDVKVELRTFRIAPEDKGLHWTKTDYWDRDGYTHRMRASAEAE